MPEQKQKRPSFAGSNIGIEAAMEQAKEAVLHEDKVPANQAAVLSPEESARRMASRFINKRGTSRLTRGSSRRGSFSGQLQRVTEQREMAEAKADKTVKRCNNMVIQLQARYTQAVHAEEEARAAMFEAKAVQASQAVALRRAHNLLSKQGGGGLEIGHTSDLLKELLLDSLVSVSTQTMVSGDQATQAMELLSRQSGMVSQVCQTDFQHEHVLLQKVDEHEALQNDLQLEVHKLQVEVDRLLHRAETAETQVPALHELLSQHKVTSGGVEAELEQCRQQLAEQTALAAARYEEVERLKQQAADRNQTRVLRPRATGARSASVVCAAAPNAARGSEEVEVCDAQVQVAMDGGGSMAKAKKDEVKAKASAKLGSAMVRKMKGALDSSKEPQFPIGWVLRNIGTVLRARISSTADDPAGLKRPLAKFIHTLYTTAYGLPAIAKKQVDALVKCAVLHAAAAQRRRASAFGSLPKSSRGGPTIAELSDHEETEGAAASCEEASCVPAGAVDPPSANPNLFEVQLFLRYYAAGAPASQAATLALALGADPRTSETGADTDELNFALRVMEQAQHLGGVWGTKGVRDSTPRHVIFPSREDTPVEGDVAADEGSSSAAAAIGGRVPMTARPLSWVAVEWGMGTLRAAFPRLGRRAAAAMRAQFEAVQESGEDDQWAQSAKITDRVHQLLSATPRVEVPTVLGLALRVRDASRRRERAFLRRAFEQAAARLKAAHEERSRRPSYSMSSPLIPTRKLSLMAAAAAASGAGRKRGGTRPAQLFTISQGVFAALLDDLSPHTPSSAAVRLHALCTARTMQRERKRRDAGRRDAMMERRKARQAEAGLGAEEDDLAGLSEYESDGSDAENDAVELEKLSGVGAIASADFAVVAQDHGLGEMLCSDHEGRLVTARALFQRHAGTRLQLEREQFEVLCAEFDLGSGRDRDTAFAELCGTAGTSAEMATFVPWWVGDGGARLRYSTPVAPAGSAAADGDAEIQFV
jgi:hypothetical protein